MASRYPNENGLSDLVSTPGFKKILSKLTTYVNSLYVDRSIATRIKRSPVCNQAIKLSIYMMV